MLKKVKREHLFLGIAIGIIALGMGLRILMLLQNRSLFIDEACLSSQLIERSYLGLFENLEYQYAPPFFAIAVKFMTVLFGQNELTLRMLPLLAALISLVLFYRLCRQFMETRYTILPLFLFSFGMPILQYATEVKQYSTDVLVTIALLLLSFRWKIETFSVKTAILWALLGSFVVWFSMPGVFILFGLGIYYLYQILRRKRWDKAVFIIIPILCWLASFGIYYFAIIRNDIGLENLEDYHSRFFMPLFPTDGAALRQFSNILLSFYQTAIGSTTLAIIFGILTSLWGLIYLGQKNFSKVLIFGLPILAVVFASGVKLYSLIPRLTLFFMPILILLIGVGQQQLFKKSPKVLQWMLIVPLLIIFINQKGYQYFYQRFAIEELRPVLRYVQENRAATDHAFLHVQATHAHHFYSNHHENAEKLKIPNLQIGVWTKEPEQLQIEDHDRLWLIFSHINDEAADRYIEEMKDKYAVLEQFEVQGARAVLLELMM